MKKITKNLLFIVLGILIAGILYYIYLPAVNIHSANFWFFLMGLLIVCMLIYGFKKAGRQFLLTEGRQLRLNLDFQEMKGLKYMGILLIAVFLVYLVGSILSSTIVNAGKYQQLLTIEERNFAADIKEADYNTIPLLDKGSAALLGNRKMGSLVDMVSQFEVSNDYTQINYQGKPVRVTPLSYASPIKWLTNQKKGIPAYILIDMATQDTECVKLPEGIKYSKSEYFNRNLYRHLRFRYPTYIFDDQLFFEIDEEGTPY